MNILKAAPAKLSLDPAELNNRLRKRVSRLEFAGLALAVIMLIVFTKSDIFINTHYDYQDYMRGANGLFDKFYYCYWFLPVFSFFNLLGEIPGYVLFCLIGILSVFFAGRILTGDAGLALCSYPLIYSLSYGQFLPILLGGAALMWWAIANRRWGLAGLGLMMALTKPHTGLIFCGILLLLANIPWRAWVKISILPALIAIASLIAYPGWPFQILHAITNRPPHDAGSLALWQIWGGWALLINIPILLIPMKKRTRYLALCLIAPLSLPYFQQQDVLMFMVLPYGPLLALLNAGLLLPLAKWPLVKTILIISLGIILANLLYPEITPPALKFLNTLRNKFKDLSFSSKTSSPKK